MMRIDDLAYVKEQYARENNLATRIRTHELYTEPKRDFTAWLLDQIEWRGDERVVDVGCGAGAYSSAVRARTLHYIAGDLSLGMLQATDAPVRVNLDAQRLPLADNRIDVLLANHMLYHVPDKDQALAEFARVLRPGGVLLAATNSATNMMELPRLAQQVARKLGGELRPGWVPLEFTLENGAAFLQRHFARVDRIDLPGALVFREAQPLIDYLATSPRYLAGFDETEGRAWQILRELVEAEIAAKGAFRVNKLTGVFRCWNE
jgi:ubiquinone/menaquinone biosynthesis C-methylase UbiE